jgi:GNAT superfamily N-acetyltransferase
MRVDLKTANDLDLEERAALRALTTAVYPPEAAATDPARLIEWAPTTWSILVRNQAGDLVSHAGIVTRHVTLDGVAVQVGGIGGVKTHPEARGRGYATAALRHAAIILKKDHRVPFSLLFCLEHLLPFYRRLAWVPFAGRVTVEDSAGPLLFANYRSMLLAGLRSVPSSGVIDLRGLPW